MGVLRLFAIGVLVSLWSAGASAQESASAGASSPDHVTLGFNPPAPEIMERVILTQDVKASAVARVAADAGSPSTRPAADPDKLPANIELKPAFDWAPFVTEAQDQDGCGCCYDFAANAALEANYSIRHHIDSKLGTVQSSEQCLLDCQGTYGCDGGWWDQPFDLMLTRGLPYRKEYTYAAKKGICRLNGPGAPAIHYRALNWGYVERNNKTFMPTDVDMKQSISLHGPIAVAFYASPTFVQWGWSHHEKTEVFWEKAQDRVNHAIVITGWDDNIPWMSQAGSIGKGAWRVKNSWGKKWGDQGFAWIAYDVNSIGFNAAWVETTSVTDPLLTNKLYLQALGYTSSR